MGYTIEVTLVRDAGLPPDVRREATELVLSGDDPGDLLNRTGAALRDDLVATGDLPDPKEAVLEHLREALANLKNGPVTVLLSRVAEQQIPAKVAEVEDRNGDHWRFDGACWWIVQMDGGHAFADYLYASELIDQYGPLVPVKWATSNGEVDTDPDAGLCAGCGETHVNPMSEDEITESIQRAKNDPSMRTALRRIAARGPSQEAGSARRILDEAVKLIRLDAAGETVKDIMPEFAEAKISWGQQDDDRPNEAAADESGQDIDRLGVLDD